MMDRCLSLCLPHQKLHLCTLRWADGVCECVSLITVTWTWHICFIRKNIRQSTIQLAAVMTSTGGYTILIPGPESEASIVKIDDR